MPKGSPALYRVKEKGKPVGSWRFKTTNASGLPEYVNCGTKDRDEANRFKVKYLAKRADDIPVNPRSQRITINELLNNLLALYKNNGYRSLPDAEARIRLHIRPYFARLRARDLTAKHCRDYASKRRSEPDSRGLNKKLKPGEERPVRHATNATINRELSLLRKAFNQAVEDELIFHAPVIPMAGTEARARQGFFTRAEVEIVCRNLPDYLRLVVLFAFLTGWRKQEVLTLEWKNVDFEAGEVRLDATFSKNGNARTFPFTAELEDLLREQLALRQDLKKRGKICPLVFPKGDGSQVGEFRKSWKTACQNSGVPGRLFHDLRRSAIRHFVRSGIPQSVAMKLSGHKTDSVFRRYDVVSNEDLAIAAHLLEQAIARKAKG